MIYQKQQGKPIIFKKSLSPPGKVSKTPERLNEPWYNESFIQLLQNSPQQILLTKSPQNAQQNIQYSTNGGVPKIFNQSLAKEVEIIKMPYQRVVADTNKLVKSINHDEKVNSYSRQNNFVAKEQEQNFINNFTQKQYQQADHSAESSIANEQIKAPYKIINQSYQLNCQQFQYSPNKVLQKQSPVKQQCVQKLQNIFIPSVPSTQVNTPVVAYSAIQSPYMNNFQISQGLNPQTQYIQINNPNVKILQSKSPIQSTISTSPNANSQKIMEENQFFISNEHEQQQIIQGIPNNSKIILDSSLNKRNDPHITQLTNNNVYKVNGNNNTQKINTSSRSLSPTQKPNITFLNYQQVNQAQKIPPFELETKQEKHNQIVYINKNLANRSGSAGSRPNEFQPVPQIQQQKLSFTPLVQNTQIVIPQNLSYQYNGLFQPILSYPSQVINNSINFQGQQEQQMKNITDNIEQVIVKAPNLNDLNLVSNSSCLQSNEKDSFKSQNSENILNYIQQQANQNNFGQNTNTQNSSISNRQQYVQTKIKNPQPSNQVRSVKCNNNFNKTISNIAKTNESIKETQQSNSSLVIQQLNKFFIDQKDTSNSKSSMISPSPITYQQANKKDPFETENYQQTLAKYYNKNFESSEYNSQSDQNRPISNQFSLGGQIRQSNNGNTSSSLSSLPKSSQITANFIDQQQRQYQGNSNDQASMIEDEQIKQMKIISQINSSLNLNTSNSLGVQGQTQEQINFYQYQNKKIQDQIDSQIAIRNMRQSEIEEAKNQLLQIKNNKNTENNIVTQIKRPSFFEQSEVDIDQSNQLEYSFNNGGNSNRDQQQQTLNIIDEVERRVQNKKVNLNYPYTIDTIQEEDLQSKIGTINQIIDKATQVTQQVYSEGIDFSINNLSLTTNNRNYGSPSTHNNMFTPQQKRIELESASPSTNNEQDQTSLFSKKSLEDNYENNFSTIKKTQYNYQQENQQNQRYQSPLQPEVLQNLNTASKTHSYQIVSPCKAQSINQSKNIQ